MKKGKLLLLTVAVLLLLAALCVTAAAEKEGIFTYTVSNGEATVTSVAKSGVEEIIMPDTLGGYPVTKLTADLSAAFLNTRNVLNGDYQTSHRLKRVSLSDGIKELPAQLFLCQYSLEEVHLPASLEKIGSLCFGNCVSLKHIDFPDHLKSVDSGAFCDCWALEEAVFPESLVSLGEGNNGAVFSYTAALKFVYLPSSLTSCASLYDKSVYDSQTASFSDIYYGGTEDQFNAMTPTRIAGVTYHFEADRAALSGTPEPERPYTVDFSDGILTVAGGGELVFDETDGVRPWDEWKDDIQTLVLDGNFTQIGGNAFSDLPLLALVIIKGEDIQIGSGAFPACMALTDVAVTGRCTVEADAFPEGAAVNVFAENIEVPADAGWNPISVQYDNGTLSYQGQLTQNAYDFFDILSVFCDHYGTIDKLKVTDFSFDGIPIFYFDPSSGQRTPIENSLQNGEIYPQLQTDEGTVSISFNDLCAGIADHSITDFYLVINDDQHPETQDTHISIIEQIRASIKRILRTIVTLLNKLFRLLNSFKKG